MKDRPRRDSFFHYYLFFLGFLLTLFDLGGHFLALFEHFVIIIFDIIGVEIQKCSAGCEMLGEYLAHRIGGCTG